MYYIGKSITIQGEGHGNGIKKEELQIIGEYVQDHLTEWLPEQTYTPATFNYPLELTERMIRVEEELKNQRELMMMGFKQIDKRFEQVDKHFEQMQHSMDKRFEQMQRNMDKRFEQVDKRFELMQNSMNIGFDKVNTSIEALSAKMFQFMIWSSGFTATVAGIVIAVIKFT